MPYEVTAFQSPSLDDAEHGGKISGIVRQPEPVLVFDGNKKIIRSLRISHGRQSVECPVTWGTFRQGLEKFSKDADAVEVDGNDGGTGGRTDGRTNGI